MDIQAPRGTNDILPPDSFKWQFIEKKIEKICQKYNYQEIRTPIFEETELFTRGIGESTDIVEKEMYTFEDKGGRSITLRPEGTAPVVRSFLENKLYGKALPIKFYYHGPMFRYERPQAGRYRQFHQFGVEVLGSDNSLIDVEIIKLGIDFLTEVGLEDFFVEINSVGCPECRPAYLDKLKNHFKSQSGSLCGDCQRRLETNPLRVLDCKVESCQALIMNAPKITENLCRDCEEDFAQVKNGLDKIEINYEVIPTLVRGLDYYTNTAFEVKSKELGAQDAIFAGGRYNGLVEEIGERDIPGVGFALGMERLGLLLNDNSELFKSNIDIYVVTIGDEAEKEGFLLLDKLRKQGLAADKDYSDRSVKSQMKDADRKGSSLTLIIGSEELKSGKVTLRNMKTGEEIDVDIEDVPTKASEIIQKLSE
ncbi:MAG: histidine--tRNA ligase [Bacillota bacterium]